MPNAWVIGAFMPPTKGHVDLIKFADNLPGVNNTWVLVCTQPDEPFILERQSTLNAEVKRAQKWTPGRGYQYLYVERYNKKVQQAPKDDKDDAFWELWKKILNSKGLVPGDYVVGSDEYLVKLSEVTETIFVPYDMDRTMNPSRATDVREDPIGNFSQIIPKFQDLLRKTVTIFGAESVGKTTLSQRLADDTSSLWLPEYARPYLEHFGSAVTTEKMAMIHRSQAALQKSASARAQDHPFIVQDTDLFSTLGYWMLWDHPPDHRLTEDAINLKSDLYIICSSDIPFEEDPLRYGGKERETPDSYWEEICKIYGLNYVVLKEADPDKRADEALEAMTKVFNPDQLKYERVK